MDRVDVITRGTPECKKEMVVIKYIVSSVVNVTGPGKPSLSLKKDDNAVFPQGGQQQKL